MDSFESFPTKLRHLPLDDPTNDVTRAPPALAAARSSGALPQPMFGTSEIIIIVSFHFEGARDEQTNDAIRVPSALATPTGRAVCIPFRGTCHLCSVIRFTHNPDFTRMPPALRSRALCIPVPHNCGLRPHSKLKAILLRYPLHSPSQRAGRFALLSDKTVLFAP